MKLTINLKVKLTLFMDILIVATVFILGTVLHDIAKATIIDTVHTTMTTMADEIATQLLDLNDKEFATLNTIANIPEFRDKDTDPKEKNECLSSLKTSLGSRYSDIIFYDKDGKYYKANGSVESAKDKNYITTALTGKKYVSNPEYNDSKKSYEMYYSVPVYSQDKALIGVLVSIINGNAIAEFTKKLDIGGGYTPDIMDMTTGLSLANNNEKQAAAGNKPSDLDPNSPFYALLGRVLSGQTGVEEFVDPFVNEKMIASYRPVGDNSTWVVFCAAPDSAYYTGLHAMNKVINTSIMLALFLPAILSIIVFTRLLKPLTRVKNSILEIASGKADLTKRIEIKTNDEIGQVVNGFNEFSSKMQSIVTDIKASKEELTLAGKDLEASTQDTSTSIDQIIENINSVHSQITIQSGSVSGTAGAVNEIASNIASLNHLIENQSAGVNEASTAVQEMIYNIKSVNESVDKMAISFDELNKKALTGASMQSDVNDKIDIIKNQSETLQEANLAISAIAEQTNLLAMNAAIEAAHAGESGKGFSVVADEIRKLSETSSQQSKTIGEQLNSIIESIESVVSSSKQSSHAFEDVTAQINLTQEIVSQIKNAMDEQNEGSKQINNVLRKMTDETVEVKNASIQMNEGNKAILEEVSTLKMSSDSMQASMDLMSNGARKITETGDALTGIASKLKDSIIRIGEEIDQFKV